VAATEVPAIRIGVRNEHGVRPDGAFVLYWMTSARRARFNFALERAVGWARELDKPLVVLEALRVGYAWASDRFHAFVIDGMRDNAAAFAKRGVTYWPYVERTEGEGKGLVEALAGDACVVVTDEYPTFFLPRMLAAVAPRLAVRLESVDGNGLVPLRALTQSFTYAHQFRRWVQKTIAPHVVQRPSADPLAGRKLAVLPSLPGAITTRWPRLTEAELAEPRSLLVTLPIDHAVTVVEDRGGHTAARARLDAFVKKRLTRYAEDRSHPDDDVASGLSFHLHFGHLSAHEVFEAVVSPTDWTAEKLAKKATGRREGFWNVSDAADAFLDELVTWRELGYARCSTTDDYMRWEGLPGWARATLEKHAGDRREHVYSRAQFEESRTHDPVWNAAMRQLREEGRIQNYLRMLWGKKIIEWSAHPKDALEILIALNDRWSVDGRDPASYTNIGWVLGSYDRPWAPERPVFGTIRYMSSDSAMRKLRMKGWLAKWGAGQR
jgi:deoxyribodipyrimidine photo-lyase